MSATDSQSPDSAPNDPTAFLDRVETLLDLLVPDGTTEIRTFSGSALSLPTALPARRQVRAFRALRELFEREDVQRAIKGLTPANSGTSEIVSVVASLATDESIADGLGAVFAAAYPDAIEGDPLDELSIEDLVRAVIPFCARFASQIGAGMQSLIRLNDES